MARLSSKLRSFSYDVNREVTGVAFWCPGCSGSHAIVTRRSDPTKHPIWTWDGNVDSPTFSPSVLVTVRWSLVSKGEGDTAEDRRDEVCHSFVEAGSIRFLGDCTHALAGQKVTLPDWPEDGDEADFYLRPPHDFVP